jgi:hypothetical protein
MLYEEIINVGSEIHKQYRNTICDQEIEFLNVKPGGIQNSRWYTEQPVVYRTAGGTQNSRWYTEQPVVYRTAGGIQNSRWYTEQPVVYRTAARL